MKTPILVLAGVFCACTAFAQPVPTVGRTSVDFGTVASGGQAEEQLDGFVANTGNERLDVTAVEITGADAAAFRVNRDDFSLEPGESMDLRFRYRPDTDGPHTATVVFTSNAATVPVVTLTGTAQGGTAQGGGDEEGPATIAVEPGALDFGTAAVEGTVELELLVTNTGTGELDVTSVAVAGADAADFEPKDEKFTLDPGEQTALRVRFKPLTPGAKAAQLSFVSNAGNAPVVPLTGTAVEPVLDISDNPLDFGTARIGEVQTRTLRIANTGDVPADIEQIVLTDQAGTFSVQEAPVFPFDLLPGEELEITIACSPAVEGELSATLDFTLDWMHDPFPVSLVCTGRVDIGGQPGGPQVQASVATVDFGTLTVHNRRDTTITIVNGDEPATVLAVALQRQDAFLLQDGHGETTLPANSEYGIVVTFAPVQPGVWSDTLLVEVDGLASPLRIPLNGTAEAVPSSVDESGLRLSATASPNPFSHSVSIRLPESLNTVQVNIVNAVGTVVRSFSPGGMGGESTIRWDGGNDAGMPVADGVYYVRITGSDGASVVPVVLQR